MQLGNRFRKFGDFLIVMLPYYRTGLSMNGRMILLAILIIVIALVLYELATIVYFLWGLRGGTHGIN